MATGCIWPCRRHHVDRVYGVWGHFAGDTRGERAQGKENQGGGAVVERYADVSAANAE